jgi:hypothetical protein
MRGARESRTQNTKNAFDIPAEHTDEKSLRGKIGHFYNQLQKAYKSLTSEVSICTWRAVKLSLRAPRMHKYS